MPYTVSTMKFYKIGADTLFVAGATAEQERAIRAACGETRDGKISVGGTLTYGFTMRAADRPTADAALNPAPAAKPALGPRLGSGEAQRIYRTMSVEQLRALSHAEFAALSGYDYDSESSESKMFTRREQYAAIRAAERREEVAGV